MKSSLNNNKRSEIIKNETDNKLDIKQVQITNLDRSFYKHLIIKREIIFSLNPDDIFIDRFPLEDDITVVDLKGNILHPFNRPDIQIKNNAKVIFEVIVDDDTNFPSFQIELNYIL